MPNRRRSLAPAVAGRRFRPSHCPNRLCQFHLPHPDWAWRRTGSWARLDGRRFQAFQCRTCRRYFSIRTFAATYWLQHRHLLARIAARAAEGPGLRQDARVLGVSHATVQRHLARAGRAALLFHAHATQTLDVREPLVADGFETFEHSQYHPFHLNLAVGAQSWFHYAFTDSPLRRKGRMTPRQQRHRDTIERTLGRPHPKAVEIGMVALLRLVLRQHDPAPTDAPIDLHTDDHPAYRRCLRRLETEGFRFRHWVTSSRQRRTTTNPLFPVNLADLLLRHGGANHRRDTIAYSKRRQGAIHRCALFQYWRNFVKWRRENQPGETPAMTLGLVRRRLEWSDLLTRRLFPRPELLPGPWSDYYAGTVRTLALGSRQRSHELKYAY
jgi:hypothetical protein